MDEEVTLTEFRRWVQDETGRFCRWWLRMHHRQPEEFPLRMPVKEWIEQFRLWQFG